MELFYNDMPQIAFYIPEGNTRIPFKCRRISDGGQFFTRSAGGLMDSGTSAVLVTRAPLKYTNGSKVILDDILYSVTAITPFIPDSVSAGVFKRKTQTYYTITLT
jgi:hypothetical protein